MGNLNGDDSIVEFLSTWVDGWFSFFPKQHVPEDLSDQIHELSRPLDKLLIEGAIAQDVMNSIFNILPGGRAAVLERARGFDHNWRTLASGPLAYVDSTVVSAEEKSRIRELLNLIDGHSDIDNLVRRFNISPSYLTVKALLLLLEHDVVYIKST